MMQEFVQSVRDTVKAALGELHTALPGEILSYDPERAAAQVRPVMQYRTAGGALLDYPVLSDVPVLFPQGAGQNVSVGFPVRPGDGCLLLLAEESLDYWRFGQQTDTRLPFDLTNALCIPGLFQRGSAAAVAAARCGGIVVDAGATRLTVHSEGVTVAGKLTVAGDLYLEGEIVRNCET